MVDSLLSEAAVLGFEYGYSLAEPRALVLWEAQFGDFANGAQVIIDQFIASGEMKWLRMSGLVLLLPHGFEGQGPEHSSARLERFLQLCADDNMQVVNLTTPANYFHALRRQMQRNFRKPLVVMTPKSLLAPQARGVEARRVRARLVVPSRAVGRRAERAPARRLTLVPDEQIKRVILCSGKVYYDLFEEREKRGESRIQILRLEQIYPFPGPCADRRADAVSERRDHLVPGRAEEPGRLDIRCARISRACMEQLGRKGLLRYAGRKAAASPAVGQASEHQAELQAFLNDALTL